MTSESAGKICRLIVMKLLPALAEEDIESFGEALTKTQIVVGEYFAQVPAEYTLAP
jgi:predicted sugar kinase